MNVRLKRAFSSLTFWALALAFPGALDAEILVTTTLSSGESSSAEEEPKPVPSRDSSLTYHLLPPAYAPSTTLLWRNGETLQGDLAGATTEGLVWRSPFFERPLTLRREVLQRIDRTTNGYSAPQGRFRFVLLDGSVFTADTLSAAEDHFSLQSPLLGSLTLPFENVVSLERLEGAGIVLPHAQALLEWKKDEGDWRLMAGGGVASPGFYGQFEVKAGLPEKGVLSLAFRTAEQIQFSIQLRAGAFEAELETWDDELILKSGPHFVSAQTLSPEEDRSLDLELYWDAATRDLALYSQGKRWAQLQVPAPGTADANATLSPTPPPAAPRRGNLLGALNNLFNPRANLNPDPFANPSSQSSRRTTPLKIHNRGAGMWIDRFQVAAWGGALPEPAKGSAPHVLTSQGTFQGKLVSVAEGQLRLGRDNGEVRSIALEELRAIHWPRTPRRERSPELTEIWFADGQLLRGQLRRASPLSMETSFSHSPLLVPTRAKTLRALLLAHHETEEPPMLLDDLDRLSFNDAILHGTIKLNAESKAPQFFPVGAEKPLQLAPPGSWTLTHAMPWREITSSSDTLIHLTSGETLPVTLQGVTGDQLHFQTPLTPSSTLDVEHIHAIQLSSPSARNADITSPNWRSLVRGQSLRRKDHGIELPPDGAMGNPYAIQGEDVSFKIHRLNGNVSFRVQLLTQGTDAESGGIPFLVAYYGNTVYCGRESSSQKGYMESNTNIQVGDDPPTLRFTFAKEEVQIHVNDTEGPKVPLGDQRKGSGMIISCTPIWGNSVESVRISDFSNSRLNFATGATAYSRQAKEEALLLPRMRRDLPPQQVIIGRNGDLLRGHLEAMTRSNLQFRTGLESVTIPKERLSAVVWLQKEIDPAAEAAELQEPTSSAPNRYWIDLNSGGRLEVSVEAWDEAQVLAQHPWLGQCRIPRADIHRIHAANPVPTPAFAALADWRLRPTQDPVIPGEEGSRSPLLGKEAPDFTLPDLAGNEVPLTDLKDKVVVLDFWATWCGPCVRSLPGLIDAMEAFSPDEVSFFAVNQGENSAQVKRFLEARRLAVAVLLDHDQSVGREYGAEAIPHTVIIAPSGKISFVKTGAGPDGNAQITEAVRAALAANES